MPFALFTLDLKHAVRGLAKAKGLALAAVVTLAFGIGANTAVFSILDGLLLAPLPFGANTQRIVTLHGTHPSQAFDPSDGDVSLPDAADFASRVSAFEAVGNFTDRIYTLEGPTGAERVSGASVTPSLFPMIGAAPALGRPFRAEDARPIGLEEVVLLSHGLWERALGSDPAIVGKTLTINGRAREVIGVMPRGFRFPEREDLWTPLGSEPSPAYRGRRFTGAFALLRPGATREAAAKEVESVARDLEKTYPETNRGWGTRVLSFREMFVGQGTDKFLALLLAAVGFVLVIGCVNLANLFLARSLAREKELAVRLALGATRGDLLRATFVEMLLLALVGGVLGTFLGHQAIRALVAGFPEELPYWVSLELDARVLGFTLAATLLSGLLAGVLPALRASQTAVSGSLAEGGRGASRSARSRRLADFLVAAEIALALALLVGGALAVKSARALVTADSGFDTSRLATFRAFLPGDRFDSPAVRGEHVARLAEALSALPGVHSAAITTSLPIDDGGSPRRAVPDGPLTGDPDRDQIGIVAIGVTTTTFQVLGLPLVSGRGFTEAEIRDPEAPVAIASKALAARFFPGREAVGGRVGIVNGATTTWLTIAGVVGDAQFEEFGEETPQSKLALWLPFASLGNRSFAVVMKASGDPAPLLPEARGALRTFDAALPLWDLRTYDDIRALTTWEQQLFSRLLTGFALAGLLLAALGVFSVVNASVGDRLLELAVRVALGAKPRDILKLVGADGVRLVAIGGGAGLALSFVVVRVMTGFLYGASGSTIPLLAAAFALLFVVVLVATLGPARRAARTDPMSVLRIG